MARTTRLTVGSIVLLTLALAVGAALAAGPALAQETTADGTDGNESMADDGMTDGGNESMEGGETTGDGDGMATGDETGTETMEDGTMAEDETMDGERMDEEGEEEMDEETASGGQPGFGVLLALTALVAAASLVRYRRRG